MWLGLLLNNLRAEPEICKAKVQSNLSTEAIDVYAEKYQGDKGITGCKEN